MPQVAPEKRIALVVGNAAYEAAPALENPVNDALRMADALKRLSFSIIFGRNCDNDVFDKKLRGFKQQITGADVALFYYSGHGLQLAGENFLIPIDARLEEEEDLKRRAFSLSEYLGYMRSTAQLSIVLLDACRVNPFNLEQEKSSLGLTKSVLVQRPGLSAVKKVGRDVFIAFAAEAGHTAVDGPKGGLSPFTQALVDLIERPGLEIHELMLEVKKSVYESTKEEQKPWSYVSLTKKFFFKPLAVVAEETKVSVESNIVIRVPRHFFGRERAMTDIKQALSRYEGRAAIIALHGLRGVGKSTLAAAFAEYYQANYRATWWLRSQTEATLRADLVALGLRLNWVDKLMKEDEGVTRVLTRLRQEGDGILLLYDNARDARTIEPFLPKGGKAHILITSHSHEWRAIADPVEIKLWPKAVGAHFLVARTGWEEQRAEAETLSEMLGGLPLAHDQVAAYCDDLAVSFADYAQRFEKEPDGRLDDAEHAPFNYHEGLTVAKTFGLAIDEVRKAAPAAEMLITYTSLLAPHAVPLELFVLGKNEFPEPLQGVLAARDGPERLIAVLRRFALVDREELVDERDKTAKTPAIRLHRLVRLVAAGRFDQVTRQAALTKLIAALATAYPGEPFDHPHESPLRGQLAPHVLSLQDADLCEKSSRTALADLLQHASEYYFWRAAYTQAAPPLQKAVAIYEEVVGLEHPSLATALENLAAIYDDQGNPERAQPILERSLSIREKVLGAEHPDTATSLNTLAAFSRDQGDLMRARPLVKRALKIRRKRLGPDHPKTAASLTTLGLLHQAEGDMASAQLYLTDALAIREKVFGEENRYTAHSLHNLARVLERKADYAGALRLYQRALAIDEKLLGTEHPNTNRVRCNLAGLLLATGKPAEALTIAKMALMAHKNILGRDHVWTKDSARVINEALVRLDQPEQ